MVKNIGVLGKKTNNKDTKLIMFEVYSQNCTQDSQNKYLNWRTLQL